MVRQRKVTVTESVTVQRKTETELEAAQEKPKLLPFRQKDGNGKERLIVAAISTGIFLGLIMFLVYLIGSIWRL